ncbi:ABC transporter permease [Saccharothrix sp. DSM 118769]
MSIPFTAATRLVAEREVKVLVRTKGFWIGFAVVVLGLFAFTVLPSVFDTPTKVAAVGGDTAKVLTAAGFEVREAADRAEAEALVRADDVEAAVVPDGPSDGVRVVALTEPPDDVLTALVAAPPVDLLEPADVSPDERQLVIFVFALVFFMFGMGGASIAQSTVTEKQTRIVEILVSTIPVRAMLAGKIVGHSVLTIAQVVVLALLTPIALRLGGFADLLAVVAPALGWFVPFMVLGFVLLASLWAVTGSLVSRQEDLGSSMGLVVMLVIMPYFGVMFFSGNATVLAVLSYLPFSSAVAMPVRVFTGSAAPWEGLLSLGVLAASVVGVVLLAARLYEGSLMRTGGKVSLAKAWARAD